MVVGVVMYYLMRGGSGGESGVGIGMGRDMGFWVGVVRVLGKGVGVRLKVFVRGLGVVDDMGGIVVMGVF